MKYLLCFVRFWFILAASGLPHAFAKDVPVSAEQLRSNLESALKAQDASAIGLLFNSKGEPNDWRESAGMRDTMISMQIREMLQTNVVSVILASLPTDFQLIQTNESSRLYQKYNMTVDGIIQVKLQNGQAIELPYGRKNDAYWLAGIVLEKIPGNSLTVRVLAGPNPDVLPFIGSWVYISGGREIKVDVDTTNKFQMRWGDYIKSCTIQRTSTNSLDVPGFAGWFYFQIKEDGATIFESPQLTNENPYVYEKK
jgi:hypothetical protein